MKRLFIYLCTPIILILCNITIALCQPVANFTASTRSGCSPVTIQFTDQSTGNPATWKWDFGNGTVSSQKNPVVTYFNGGFFTVTLTVSNAGGSNSITKTQFITVYDKPVVNFSVSDSLNCIPFTTRFSDLSSSTIGTINQWEWDFDDGTTSATQHPQHLYTQPANYNITLKVTNSGGCSNSLSKLAYVKAADSIRTLFSFSNPFRCKPPETIRFTNNTAGPGPFNYTWDFGDGTTSGSGSPSHTYLNGGLYTVKLIVRNNFGCIDTLTYKDTLRIKNVISNISSADTVCLKYTIPFINATVPVPLSSRWTFSDGSTTFGAVTSKVWNTPGNHTVTLVSNFSNCSDTVTKRIRVLTDPVVNFSASDSGACMVPFAVSFFDLTPGATQWLWDFGDGAPFSNTKNPSHTYTVPGIYSVTLTVTNSAGCTVTLKKTGWIKVFKPVVSFSDPNSGGCIPYTYNPVPSVLSADGIASYLWDFGGGNTSSAIFPSQVYSDTGTFAVKLTVMSNDGCVESATIPTAVRTGVLPVVDFGISQTVVCPGSSVSFTDLSIPADKWLWDFGDATDETKNPAHTFGDSGWYSIKLVAWNNGCKDSIIKYRVVSVLPGMAQFRPFYQCGNKREVYFKDSSLLPQNWLWDFGDGTTSTASNPTHQFPGYQTYNVILTTVSNTCTDTRVVLVTPVNEMPDFTAGKNTLCKNDSVAFYLKSFNKNNIAKYIWDFGDGTIDSTRADSVVHVYTRTGAFTVKLSITDIHGCSETNTKVNLIHVFSPNAGFTINANGGCLNKIVNFTDTSNNISGYHNIAVWNWDFGDGQMQVVTAPGPSTVPHIYAGTGYYYPSLKIIDSAGCSDSASYNQPITINQPLASFFSPNFNSCINDTVLFRNPSAGKGLSYLWTFGDGSFSVDSLPVKKYLMNGDFTVKLVVTDTFGCRDSMTKNNYVKVRQVTASFRASDTTGICIPFQVDFTNTSTNTLSQVWNFGDGGISSTTNPSYHYTTPGIYAVKLTAKRSATCYAMDSIRIRITAPTATLSYSPHNGCAPLNVSFKLSTMDSVSFIWDFNDGVSFESNDSSVVHSYVLPGSFVPAVILKNNSGCLVPVVGTDTIRLFSSKVNFSADDTLHCDTGTVRFTSLVESGSPIAAYRWDFGDGTSSFQQNPVHFYDTPGTYPVQLNIATQYGCNDSLAKPGHIRIAATPAAIISGSLPSYCGPSSLTLQARLAVPDTSAIDWNWNFGNGNTAGGANPTAQQYSDTGIYTIQLTAINSSGCTGIIATTITINPVPNTTAGPDTAICSGIPAPLRVSGADSYSWLPASYLSCTNCSNPITSLPDDGSYYVTGTNLQGCTKTDTVFVVVKKPFRLNGLQPADSVCAGQSMQLNVGGTESYSWSPTAGLSNAAVANPVVTPAATVTYRVIGSDSSNCYQDTAFIVIKVNSLPVVNAGADIISNSGRSVVLFPQYSGDVVKWLWQPATGLSCIDCPGPTAAPASGTTYTLRVTNGNGCTAEDQIFVQVKCDQNNVSMPTAFTPGSSRNSIFYPLNTPGTGSIKIVSFKIYNRYGQMVFQNGNFYSNDSSKGWDGIINGKQAAPGTYIYTIEFICYNSQPVAFGGNILLLR